MKVGAKSWSRQARPFSQLSSSPLPLLPQDFQTLELKLGINKVRFCASQTPIQRNLYPVPQANRLVLRVTPRSSAQWGCTISEESDSLGIGNRQISTNSMAERQVHRWPSTQATWVLETQTTLAGRTGQCWNSDGNPKGTQRQFTPKTRILNLIILVLKAEWMAFSSIDRSSRVRIPN